VVLCGFLLGLKKAKNTNAGSLVRVGFTLSRGTHVYARIFFPFEIAL
jgi:hypothetical protein